MAHFRNVSGRDIYLPRIGVVLGEHEQGIVEVPDDELYQYTASTNFEPVGAESTGLHEAAAQEEATNVADAEKARTAGVFYDHPDAGRDDVVDEPEAGGIVPVTPQGVVETSTPPGEATNVDTGTTTPAGEALPPIEPTPPAGG